MKNLISLKAIALFVSMLACSITFSGCSDEEEGDEFNAIQAEVVFPSDVNLTKIDQWESSIELEQLGTIIPFEIKSNSAWEIYLSFDDERFCFAYPYEGAGNATVDLCVKKNLSDERCTGKMHIVFADGSTKSKIVHLSQKGNIDNDENDEIDDLINSYYYYTFRCPLCNNPITVLLEDIFNEDKADSIVTCPYCEEEMTYEDILMRMCNLK